jgi:hypothetical protein
MFDGNKDQLKIESAKLLSIVTEIILLIAFTIAAYICLLYCAKYLWFLYTATDIGQTYAKIFEENYRRTDDLLSRNFISLAVNLTLISFVICFIAGAIFKFLHFIRFFYSDRGFLSRIIFIGLPLTFIVAVYIYYNGNFNQMDVACMVAFVPTLCVFAGCFRFAEELVPALFDLVNIFSGKQKTVSIEQKEENVRSRANASIQKKDIRQSGTVWQDVSHDIWESLEAYIAVVLIITLIAGILILGPQIKNYFTGTKTTQQVNVPIDTTTEQKPAPVKEEINSDERFVAYPEKTVFDKKTRLMWAAEESETLTWDAAKKYCRKYRGGGYKDWRMPALAELESLYDAGRQPDCGCITNLIEMANAANCWEWSSETKGSDAAFFAFNLNGKQWLPKSNNSSVHIRPVRVVK